MNVLLLIMIQFIFGLMIQSYLLLYMFEIVYIILATLSATPSLKNV